MDVEARLKALLPIWSWLPSFRAVAETEHLPSAADLSGTGPSSLSRALSLLERELGKPLFVRTGRSLTLNADGHALLEAVRDAMRRIDDGLEQIRGEQLRGTLTIASAGAGTTALVAPAIERLRREHPGLVPHLLTRTGDDIAQELLGGRLDIVFQESPMQHHGLTTIEVGNLPRSVYCGKQHPLFAPSRVTSDDLAASEFVAPPDGDDGRHLDGWPATRRRTVALRTDQLRVGLELCIDQPLLAVLPDVLAATRSDELRRLSVVPIEPSPVFAVYRRVLGQQPSPAAQLANLVKAPRRRR